MLLNTFYIFVVCLSIQSSIGFDFENAADRILLQKQHQLSNESTAISTVPAAIKDVKTCERALQLQKILGLMISMLRQDLSENSKTSLILESLKDMLRNSAAHNEEVIYKIDDLIRTLDKYNDPRNKIKELRIGVNSHNPMQTLVKRSTKLNPKIKINYELPVLKNSYCTEVLLNVINIAYRAYANLAKNPICNLPNFPNLPPGVKLPETDPLVPGLPASPNSNLEPKPFHKKKSPSSLDLSFGDDPVNSNNFNPSNNILNPYSQELPSDYIPVYSYKPESNPRTPLSPLQNKLYFPVDEQLQSQPLNLYYPDVNNPLYNVKVPALFPKSKNPVNPYNNTPQPNPNNVYKNPQNVDSESPVPFRNQPDKPKVMNPLVINSIYPNSPYSKYNFPQPLTGQPESKNLKYIPHFRYMIDDNNLSPAEPDVSKRPYNPDTLTPNNLHNKLFPDILEKGWPFQEYPSSPSASVPVIDDGVQKTENKISSELYSNNLLPYFFPVNSLVKDPSNPNSPNPVTDSGSPGAEILRHPYKPDSSKPSNLLPYFHPVNSFVKNPSSPYAPVPVTGGKNTGIVSKFPYKPDTSKPSNLLPYVFPVNSLVKKPNSPNSFNPVTDGSSPGAEVLQLPYKPDTSRQSNLLPQFFAGNSIVKNPSSSYAPVPVTGGKNTGNEVSEFPYEPDTSKPTFFPVNSIVKDPSNLISSVPTSDADSRENEVYGFPYKPDTSKPSNLLPYFFPVNSLVKKPNSANSLIPVTDGGSPGAEVLQLPYELDTSTPNKLLPHFFPLNSLIQDPGSPNAPFPATNGGSPGNVLYKLPHKPSTLKPSNLLSDYIPFSPFIKDPSSAPVPITDGGSPGNKVYELPYKLNTPKPSDLHPYFSPVNPFVEDPSNSSARAPVTYDGTPEIKDEFNSNPKHLGPGSLFSPGNSYIPNLQNPNYGSSLNPKTPDNPFFFKTLTPPPNTLKIQDLKIIGFIKEAIAIIESAIPIVQFDTPTLYIIAEIKNILLKDIGIDDYVTILQLYQKLINYVKHLNAYKQIIDLIDLPSLTNRLKLKTEKVVELTYLVKRPQPVIYYPYYYIKYRLPYPAFMIAAKNLLREKPHLRTMPNKLYDELLTHSKLAETSPALKNYEEKDILGLTFKSGTLVDAKLIGENGTLTKLLNITKHINADLIADEILEFNNEANPGGIKNLDNEQIEVDGLTKKNKHLNEKVKIEKSKHNVKQQISSQTHSLLRTESLGNIYQNDLSHQYSTTEVNLDFTSFESKKLRDDILRGEYVGLPFSNYVIPTNANPLNSQIDSNAKIDQGSIANKIYNATLKASNIRETNQQNLINSGGLLNLDNGNVYLNTGTDNFQQFVNISNPKVIMNSAASFHSLKNTEKTKTHEGNFNHLSLFNTAFKQNSGNMWTNQKNYYNSGGLLNFDNQKIFLNTGTGNRQQNVNLVNTKTLYNVLADSRTSQAPTHQHSLINENKVDDGTVLQKSTNTDPTERTVTQQIIENSSINPTEASKRATSHEDSLKFDSAGKGISIQNGKLVVGGTQTVVEQTTRRQRPNLNQSKTQLHDTVAPNQQEMVNFIKNTFSDNSGQFANTDSTKTLHNTDERHKPDSKNFNYYDSMRPSDGNTRPHDGHDLTNINSNTLLPTKSTGHTKSPYNTMTINQEANQGQIKTSPGTNNPKNTVSANNNQLYLPPEIEYQDIGNFGFNTGMESQQNYGGTSQQNIKYETGMTGQAAGFNQQNIATYGSGSGYPGFQINSYVVTRRPIFYNRQIIERFPTGSGYLGRFRSPVNYYLG